MEVGGHTVNHPVLATLAPERQRAEITGSLERLREELPGRSTSSATPSVPGSFDATTRTVLAEQGVRRAFSFYGGVNGPVDGDPMDVRRVGVFRDYPVPVVQAMAALPNVLCRAAPVHPVVSG